MSQTSPTSLEYQSPALKVPLSRRFNWRLTLFLLVIIAVVGGIMLPFFDMTVSGGIKDVGGGFKEVDLKAMSNFLFDQNNGTNQDVPEKWRALDNQKVILYGEMWAPRSAGPYVTDFQLCYSIAKCCFSGPPQVQHFVNSTAPPTAKLSYYSGLVKVAGTLHVNVKRDAGKVQSVYQMDVASIEPVQ
jgi:hypothetical protein